MRKRWLNEKDENGHYIPNEDGDFELVIETNGGNRVSSFKGKTMDEVADIMADAQVHANRQLGRLLKPDQGRGAALRVEPREITPEDRLRLSSEISDPNKVVEAVTEIITKKQGMAPDVAGQRVAAMDQREADAYYKEEAEAFVETHPGYYPVEQNQQMLFRALEDRRYDLTRNNLGIVYEALMDAGRLIPWPQQIDAPPEEEAPPSAAPPKPRTFSSGLRNSDASASKPAPPRPKPVITRAELEMMSRHEYQERLRDPNFRRAVDALGTNA